MRRVRKRRVWLQNQLLYFVSRAGGVSCIRARDTLSPRPHKTDADMNGPINPIVPAFSFWKATRTRVRSGEVSTCNRNSNPLQTSFWMKIYTQSPTPRILEI